MFPECACPAPPILDLCYVAKKGRSDPICYPVAKLDGVSVSILDADVSIKGVPIARATQDPTPSKPSLKVSKKSCQAGQASAWKRNSSQNNRATLPSCDMATAPGAARNVQIEENAATA